MLFVLNGMNLQDRHLDIKQQPFLIATDRLISTVIILNCVFCALYIIMSNYT